MNEPIVKTCLFLIGIYEIAYGFRESFLSSFRFYWIAGLMRGCVLLGLISLAVLFPSPNLWVWEIGAFLLYAGSHLWQGWKAQRIRSQAPPRWVAWETRRGQANALQKIFFYAGIARVEGR